MRGVFLLPGALERSEPVEHWLAAQPGERGALARTWLTFIRQRGDNVRVLMHDGCPTACVEDAAFAYVGVFAAHVSVGFFHGAALPDPARLLQGTGTYMRHVKIVPGRTIDGRALEDLIAAAYDDIAARLLTPKDA